MVLILLYWLLLLLIFIPSGVVAQRLLGLTQIRLPLTILLGMVLNATVLTVTAFFCGLGMQVFISLVVLNLLAAYTYREQIQAILTRALYDFKLLPSFLKVLLGVLFIGTLLKSAQFPFVIDNESYYLQTIKWLNEYGIVTGIANLHPFLAQNSAWHILQAGCNLSFINAPINDINGFLFIVCLFYYITESHTAYTLNKQYHWLGFVPVFSLLLFQFVPAPSPDMPCLLLVPIIFHLYLTANDDNDNLKTAFVLFVFLCIIKMTTAAVGLIFLPSVQRKKMLWFMMATGVPLIVLWCVKNLITSGYPFYPFPYFKTEELWAMPTEMYRYLLEVNANEGYYDRITAPQNNTLYTKLLSWVKLGGLAGMVNKLTLLLLAVVPFFSALFKDKKMRLIYAALLINFMLLLLTSPQFRYFLHVTLCLALLGLVWGYNRLNIQYRFYKITLWFGVVVTCILFTGMPLKYLTKNRHHQSADHFSISMLLIPEPNTKFPDMQFKCERKGNLGYYSPQSKFFIYGTSNGPLPCVNKKMINFYERKLNIYPQLRDTTDMGKGFYSERLPSR